MKIWLYYCKRYSEIFASFRKSVLCIKCMTIYKKYSYVFVLSVCSMVVMVSGITYSYKNATAIDLSPSPLATMTPIVDEAATSIHDPILSQTNIPNIDVNITIPLIKPVDGGIISNITSFSPIFSSTLQQYRIHTGIDFSGNLGELVICAADGIIKNIYKDSLYGNTIEVLHSDNSIARYANLGTLEMVTLEMHIYAGDVIGTIGNSALVEAGDAPHLHFEFLVDGKHTQPTFVE